MTIHLNHARHALHGFKEAAKHDGAKGALAGAVGTATAVATGVGLAGLALTPLGWALAAGVGATAGGTGLFKKVFGKR
jgi:hypothetical protein